MPDSEELEKKEKREFMRETIVKPPLTRKQIAKRVALFVCASAVFGGVAAVSFAAVKPFADRCFQENGMQETSSVEFSKDDPDSVSPSDGADADMTAQPEQMEQEIDEAVSEALSSYQFSADNFNSMTSVLRGIGEQGDKSIVTVSSGKQDTDIFGNPVENTGDYAGAVIAESDGEFLIFTYADAVRAADSINVRFRMERRSLVQCARLTKCSEWQLWRCRPAICRKKSGKRCRCFHLPIHIRSRQAMSS